MRFFELLENAVTDTPAFKAWFKNSKVVNYRTKKPMVVYHGTTIDFDRFAPASADGGHHAQAFGPGYYFTDHPARAKPYATRKVGAHIKPCYLSLQNPKVFGSEGEYFHKIGVNGYFSHNEKRSAMTEKLKAEGYDGIMIYRTELPGNSIEYVAFYPNQIKSVMNQGTFSTNSDHLNESLIDNVVSATQKLMGHPFDSVNSEAEAYYGTTDRDQLVEIVHADLMRTFAKGSVLLYRVVNVPDAVILALKPGGNLGPIDNPTLPASWTLDPTEFEFSALLGDAHHPNIENYFLFTAMVPLNAVDVASTIAQNIELHWEREVALKRGMPIRLESIHRVGTYASNPKSVRTTFWGTMMRS